MTIPPGLPASHRRFPLLDSLRGLAAIAILGVHVSIFSIGEANPWYERFVVHLDIGVSFFFLLSAFLLYRPFVRARVLGDPRPSMLAYAERRATRILPAYWAALTIAAIVPGLVGAFSGNWWAYYGLLQNYPIYTPEGVCATFYLRCAIPPAWSLGIEVAFYALLPVFVIAMERIVRRRRGAGWLRTELIAIGAIALASFLVLAFPPNTDLRLWLFYSPLGRGWWFGLGLALAAVSVWVEQRSREPRLVAVVRERSWALLAAAGALYVLACLALPSTAVAFPLSGQLRFEIQYLLFGLIALLVLLPGVFGDAGPGAFRAFLRHRWTTWLGLISYGIFLWQFPVLIGLLDIGILDGNPSPSVAFVLLLGATFAGTVICAAISYYVLERPLMRWVRARTRAPDPPASVRPATEA